MTSEVKPPHIQLYQEAPFNRAIELMNNTDFSVVLDVDEVCLHTLEKHIKFHNIVYPENRLTYEQVIQAGSTQAAYGHINGQSEFNEGLNANARYMRHINPMSQSAAGVLAKLPIHGFKPSLYLTTRPHPNIPEEVTIASLVDHGFPNLPVIGRPDSVLRTSTTEWKIDVLKALSQKTRGVLIMIDDNESLIAAIEELADPRIKSVLFKGPFPTSDRFLKANWDEMLDALLQIKATTEAAQATQIETTLTNQ